MLRLYHKACNHPHEDQIEPNQQLTSNHNFMSRPKSGAML